MGGYVSGADTLLGMSDTEAEKEAWRWIFERVEPYPEGSRSLPYATALPDKKARPVVACQIVCSAADDPRNPLPAAILVNEGLGTRVAQIADPQDTSVQFDRLILLERHCGSLVVFHNGSRYQFHVILRHIALGLNALGYTIQPIMSGCDIRCLTIRRDRHVWCLCDIDAMLGTDGISLDDMYSDLVSQCQDEDDPVRRLWLVASAAQAFILAELGVACKATLGSTTARACQVHLPDDGWLWRPDPLMVAVCREGGGYRGGYVYAQRYKGLVWQADVCRMYTWAMSQRIPTRWGIGHYQAHDKRNTGFFMSVLSGRPTIPAYLALWRGAGDGFGRGYYIGGPAVALCSSEEIPGLEAIGIHVCAGAGCVGYSYTTLAGYVTRLGDIFARGQSNRTIARISKMCANLLYGKLAQNPSRISVAWSPDRPAAGGGASRSAAEPETGQAGERARGAWYGAVDNNGDEIENVWWCLDRTDSPYHHVDVAAMVTARARCKVYQGMAAVLRAGGQVVHADTDSIMATIPLDGVLPFDPASVGGWRRTAVAQPAVVLANKTYWLGGIGRCAGVPAPPQEQYEAAYSGDSVWVAGRQLRAPTSAGALWVDTERLLSR